jgi:hypothetical protein
MKTLNDILRQEFNEILTKADLAGDVSKYNLDNEIISKAFDILLEFKYNPNSTDRGKTEFENYIINTLKTRF